MKKNAVVALGLLLGFSAHSVFAESKPINYSPVPNELADRLAQVQLQAIEAKSRFLDEVNAGRVKTIRSFPSSNNNRNPNKRDPKPPAAGRKRTSKEEIERLKDSGNWKPSENADSDLLKSTKVKVKNNRKFYELKLSKREARIYELLMNARNLDQLTQNQKMQILALHKRILNTVAGKVVLETIQICEDGGPLVIVGKGIGKSKKFKEIMKRLNLSTHPAYQFPKDMRCFVHNKYLGKCSTASGLYQITKTNFDFYAKQFGLKDFSIESQKIIALELIRTGQAKIVKGNYKGRGYVELVKGNIDKAIRYGTNDWASSPYSEWQGAKRNYVGTADLVAQSVKKSESKKDRAYYQNWLTEFESEVGS